MKTVNERFEKMYDNLYGHKVQSENHKSMEWFKFISYLIERGELTDPTEIRSLIAVEVE